MFHPHERKHGSEGMKKAEFKEKSSAGRKKHHIEEMIDDIIEKKGSVKILNSPHLWIFRPSQCVSEGG